MVEAAFLTHLFEVLQTLDGLPDGAEIGQHAAKPAVRYVWHCAALRFLLDRGAGRAFGADENHGAALGGQAADEIQRVHQQRQRLFQVDDMNLAPGSENIRCHLGIPITGLMPEMHASLEHLAHGDIGHDQYLSYKRKPAHRAPISWVNPPCTLAGNPVSSEHPTGQLRCMCVLARRAPWRASPCLPRPGPAGGRARLYTRSRERGQRPRPGSGHGFQQFRGASEPLALGLAVVGGRQPRVIEQQFQLFAGLAWLARRM